MLNRHMGNSMLPEGVEPNQFWVATIEGRPSVKMAVDLKASMETRERFVQMSKHPSEPGYHAVVATFLQALPDIVAAPPGIMPVALPVRRWKKPKAQ
jgi:2,4-diaminopentanoate dehydrogenase